MQSKCQAPCAESSAPATWIGADIAKLTVDAAIHKGPAASFPRTKEGMDSLLAWARQNAPAGARLRLVMEATGRYSTEALGWLRQADPSLEPACVNPLHAKRFAQSLGQRNKNDRADARMLARLGAERMPAPWQPLGKALAEIRSLVRERRELVKEKTRLKNRIKEGADSAFVKAQRAVMLKAVCATIKRIDAELKRVAWADAGLKADVKRLCTIPGVALVTAVTVLAEMGDMRRFTSGRQLAAFAGLSPRHFESGSSVRGKTRMCKQGNGSVRAILYMAAMTSSRMSKGMKATYDHLVSSGKAAMSALGALMRRLLLLMRTLLISGQDYLEPVERKSKKAQLALA